MPNSVSRAVAVPSPVDIGRMMKLGLNYGRRMSTDLFRRSPVNNTHLVLMYHRVVGESDISEPLEPGMWVSSRTFDEQIAYLQEKYDIVPLGWLVDVLRERKSIRSRLCAVTFDDGWRDNFDNALPVLAKYDIPATVFLATGVIGSNDRLWVSQAWSSLVNLDRTVDALPGWPCRLKNTLDRLACCGRRGERQRLATASMEMIKGLPADLQRDTVSHLAASVSRRSSEREMLDWDEVRKMKDYGIDFGAHTENHAILTGLSRLEMEREVIRSKEAIESVLGERVKAFSYPNGDWNEEIIRFVREAGYDYAVGTKQSHCGPDDDLYAIPRVGAHEGISQAVSGFSRTAFGIRLEIA